MTPERWQRIEGLYDAAGQLPTDQRDPFLQEHCPDDSDVRREVAAMLECGDDDETLRIIVGAAAANAGPIDDTWEGRRLGAWKVVRPIGEGGMGTVFLGVRDDDQYRQAVAIKTLRFEA